MKQADLVTGCLISMLLCSVNSFSQSKNSGEDQRYLAAVADTGTSWNIMPSIASWNMRIENIDLAANRSPFNVLTSLGSVGKDRDHMEDDVHDKLKLVATHAAQKGISLVADLDVRMALPTFGKKYPDELQQMLVFRQIALKGIDTLKVVINSRELRDHYHRPYMIRNGSFVRAYAYNLASGGNIDPNSLKEITTNCIVDSASKNNVKIRITPENKSGRTMAMVVVSFTYLYPDVFAPHLMDFQSEIIKKYADIPLAGALYDEWGFPAALSEESIRDEFWYSTYMADIYRERTGGRELVRDMLLMHTGIKGQEDQRSMAINHYREMSWQRNGALENNFYHTVKNVFGPKAIVAVHPTWFPYPERREFKKNGLDWWVATRDWAQTDEVTPFAVRTSLAKKWKSPLWYNMFYRLGLPQGSVDAEDFEQELWSSTLAGGRVNNLSSPLSGILGNNYVRAEARIRLLNYIRPSPLDCPVAVVFGHAAAMNWNGPYFEDLGMKLVDSLWSMGIPVDLIPSSEIENGSLIIGKNGAIHYGPQRYTAVILYNPEFEKPSTATFFNKAAKGETQLFRIGKWSKDFDGKFFDGNAALPKSMAVESSIALFKQEVYTLLKKRNIGLQTRATRIMDGFGHTSLTPPATGFCRLIDGTLILVAGTHKATGDLIDSNMKIGNHDVAFNAVGVAAVRLDKKGRVQALAAGGLKYFKSRTFSIKLDERIDIALWRNDKGQYQGIIQGLEGNIPTQLLTITKKWARLNLPVPLPSKKTALLKKAFFSNGTDSSKKVLPELKDMIKDIDGNSYQVVKIGDQVWMAENLRTSRFNDGNPISSQSNKVEWSNNYTGAYSWYENDSSAYENRLGKLYNWHVVKTGKICPKGWHVPDEKDWNILLNSLGATSEVLGEKNVFEIPEPNPSKSASDNQKRFNPIASGYRHTYGSFASIGRHGIWWSSSNTRQRAVWNFEKKYFYFIDDVALSPSHGICIRCIKRY